MDVDKAQAISAEYKNTQIKKLKTELSVLRTEIYRLEKEAIVLRVDRANLEAEVNRWKERSAMDCEDLQKAVEEVKRLKDGIETWHALKQKDLTQFTLYDDRLYALLKPDWLEDDEIKSLLKPEGKEE